MKTIRAILLGAGSRGRVYADIISEYPGMFTLVGVAEPIEARRNYIKEKHALPDDRCFSDWKDLISCGKIADVAIVCTTDRAHYKPAIELIKLGYDLLIEKPLSNSEKETLSLAEEAEKYSRKIVVCTVLRFTRIFRKVKELIEGGKLGKIISLNHEENIAPNHFTHSFVRGNFSREEDSSFLLLQKSCHDLDLISWLVKSPVKSVSSFGCLSYFKRENAPSYSADMCVDCKENGTCPFSAVKIYLDDKENRNYRSNATGTLDPTDEEVYAAISKNKFGRCAFKCDNDVLDHQSVGMIFEDGATATLSINALTRGGRFMQIFGTEGTLTVDIKAQNPIVFYDFKNAREEIIPPCEDTVKTGRGGGDYGLMRAFYEYENGVYIGNQISGIREVAQNHLICFAAEKARKTDSVIDFRDFVSKI